MTSADWTEGIALRYGGFYGPGTSIGLDPLGEQVEMIRQRKFPIAGKGTGVWSFIHIEDAAAATVEAVEHGTRGVYNVVDDEPAPVSEWLPELAQGGRRQAAPPRAALARTARRRRGGSDHDERLARLSRTKRRSASSAGSRATRAGARASRKGLG